MMFLTINRKFIFSICILVIAGLQSIKAQTYATGRITFTYNDPARTGGFGSGGGAGRQIQSELYYPAATAGTNVAVASGRFPVVVFAHGFQMTWDVYENFYDSLVRNGYIVVAPRTEGGLSPNHTDFGKDLAIILDRTLQFDTISGSPFLGKIVQKGAIAGHSMGGGSTFLADQYTSRATCYFTMAPANTNPRSSLAAKTITKPFCILAGTRDCVAPIADHQQVMYDSLQVSTCKQLVKITDARHCGFSDGSSTQCNFGEGFSGCASSPLTTAQQVVIARNCMIPYFNYFLKGVCSEWAVFQNYITTTAALTTTQSCSMNVPSNAAITGINSFCVGSNTTLTAAPAGFSYAWSNAATSASTTVSAAGNYTVSVSNPYCTIASAPYAISQKNIPATPTAISGSDTVCANATILNFSTPVVPTATSYQWTFPSGWSIINGTSASPTFTANTMSGAISVSAVNTCGTSSSFSKNVVVSATPPSPSPIIGLDTVCPNSSLLSYSINPISGATSYQWVFPQGWSITNGNSPNPTFTAGTIGGTISVSAVTNCGTTTSVSKLVTIGTVLSMPSAISGPDSFCVNSGAKTYSTATVAGATSYQWTAPNGWVGNSTTNTITFTNPTPSGTLSVAALGNCGAGNSVSKIITVIDTPQGVLTIANSLAQTSATGTSYEWFLNGVSYSATTVPSIAVVNTGNYTVKVSNAFGCSSLSNAVFYQNVGIETITKTSYTLYPNPTDDYFIIQYLPKATNWKLYNAVGQKVLEGVIDSASQKVNIAGLEAGVYLFEVKGEKSKLVVK